MDTLNVIVNDNRNYYMSIIEWTDKIISVDLPYYVKYKYDEKYLEVNFSYMFVDEEQTICKLGLTTIKLGIRSGKIYQYQALVGRHDPGFVEPLKFREMLNKSSIKDSRAKSNILFGLNVIERVINHYC